jgi:hypothetical protein
MYKRAIRFDAVCPVILSSELFGECNAIVRNISATGTLLELSDPLPLGCKVRIVFASPLSQATIVARGEVKNHYFFNYNDGRGARALTGMGVRFVEFEPESDGSTFFPVSEMRILH